MPRRAVPWIVAPSIVSITSLRASFGAAAIVFILAVPSALALDPDVRITQYRHTVWRVQEGAFESAPNAIAQAADGYLWIGTGSGLLRYDGVRFRPWTPATATDVTIDAVYALRSATDGALWIGTATRLLRWKGDHLQEFVRGRINAIVEDRQHRIWAARSRPPDQAGGLCQVVGEAARCLGGDDRMGLSYAVTLAEDTRGNLWVGGSNQLMRWHDGSFDSYFRDQLERFQGLSTVEGVAAAPDGSVWAAIPRAGLGLLHIVDGVPKNNASREMNAAQMTSLFVDGDRSLWVGTSNDGILRVSGERVDHFRSQDGLSSNAVIRFFEDREGSLWVATSKGLDCFRNSRIVTFSAGEGLSADFVGSVIAADDGTVWIGNRGTLDRLHGGEVSGVGVPGRRVTSLWLDHAKRLWVGVDNELATYEHGQFQKVNRPDGSPLGTAIAITEDREQNLWVSVIGADRKVFRIRDRRVEEEFANDRIPFPRVLAADPTGGIWLGLVDGSLGHYRSGKLEIFRTPQAERSLFGVAVDADGSAWAPTTGGLVRWKNREMKTLTSKNGLPCDGMFSAIRDNRETLWIFAKCGLIGIADSELERWWQEPDAVIEYQLLDVFDGAIPAASTFQPAVAKSADGRLWFVNDAVLQGFDPGRLRRNQIPPPVHVEAFRADRRNYAVGGLVHLPARSRDIEIGYTALSFAVPQRVRFRYRLDGRDNDWNDAGARREAFYSDLTPGYYRFRVTGSNDDGVWNDAGATVDFVVAAAFYQTYWFLALAVGMTVALVWSAHRIRLRIVEAHGRQVSALNERLMKAQEQERMRIAGELHDGVMQQMLSVTMLLGSAKRRVASHPTEATATIEKVQEKLIQAGTDIRQLSHGLHPPILQEAGLPEAARSYCEEFSAARGIPVSCNADPRVRELSPGAALALFRVLQEALGNAARHASPKRITVGLMRTNGDVSLTVSDDGAGFDVGGTGAGGLGLVMMRERASQLNGTFHAASTPGRGTTISVVIPFR